MVEGRRKKRLESLLLRAIADLLTKEVQDPRLEGVSITTVTLTEDFSEAKVFFYIHKGQDLGKVKKGFESAKGFLRAELGHIAKLRRTPDLKFIYDDTLDLFDRIKER
ncbi:MAG: 30S ribosome-binding factor RbfA [Proteobacteria bacterium]|nr:30S ribosome-binding factor RbfA [Pseudomonadota bacterium]